MNTDKQVRLNGEERNHVYGFISENELAGTIAVSKDDKTNDSLKVNYKHLKNEENRIHYFAASGDHSIISIISIPIHDHSSIYQGGPAFGTYYYDKSEPSPENTGE